MGDKPQADNPNLVIPYLSLRSKPKDIPTEIASELAGILIEWGAFENALILDLEQLRMYPQVSKLSDAVPYGFNRKIELWKRSIYALFAGIPLYVNTAREICSKGKMVARQRHRLIHGLWRPAPDEPGVFQVLSGFDHRQQFGFLKVDLKFAADLHRDITTMTNETHGFLITRMLHAAQGLLTAQPAPSLEHPAHPNPPTAERH